jgi:hypothetical protein
VSTVAPVLLKAMIEGAGRARRRRAMRTHDVVMTWSGVIEP